METRTMSRVTELHVNGAACAVDADSGDALLDVLRDDLGLTGCKISCGEGACGACTVLVDSQPLRSCITPVGRVARQSIQTIEGLALPGRLHPVQQAFIDCDALQCGYCTPGMIMSVVGLLEREPDPGEQVIVEAMQGNICRCGAYSRIVRAIRQAAAALRQLPSQGGA
jgi:aerobic-type carbon monoxide dehydrogenase small subunit (CoxS/CutS family)